MGTRTILFLAFLLGGMASAGQAFPNDPYYGNQWYGPLLGLPAAWDITQGRSDVTIAILDTGVMANTPDLAGRLLPPLSATGSPALDGTTNHHGTWVASVVGMGINNGLGGAGVGDFTLLPVTVTNSAGGNMSEWVAEGIRLAADAGARVINVSQRTLSYSLLNEAAGYARSKGALVFVAAGNTDRRWGLTGCDNLVFVAGTDDQDARWDGGAEGSTWGPFVDLAAPAWHVVVADPTLGSGYGIGDGTSFATPLAAGAAGLVWSVAPSLTPEEVLAILYDTAVDLGDTGRDDVFGHGRLDIGAAVSLARDISGLPEPATLGLLAAGLVLWGAGRRATRPR